MTWLENYANCSLDLYGDLRLVEKPDLVSDTEEGAWSSAFWYWNKYVHDIPEVKLILFDNKNMKHVFLDTRGKIWLYNNGYQRPVRMQWPV